MRMKIIEGVRGGDFVGGDWGGGGVKMDQKVPLKLGATGDAFCATAGKNVPTPDSHRLTNQY